MKIFNLQTIYHIGFCLVFIGTLGSAPVGYAAEEKSTELPSVDDISGYDFGQSREAWSAIEAAVREATPEQRQALEEKLIAVLEQPDATYAAKLLACKTLRPIASEKSIPALAGMLQDEMLSDAARYALQGHPSDKAGAAIREALRNAKGAIRIGLIGTLAERRDRDAVSMIASEMNSEDDDLARAAIKALGRIGGRDAAMALREAKVSEALETQRQDALLSCADGALQRGYAEPAANLYRELSRTNYPVTTRLAAYRGLARAEKENAIPQIVALMSDENKQLREAAAGSLLAEISGEKATKAVAEALPSLQPETQVIALAALKARGDRNAIPAVTALTSSESEDVQVAAIQALALLGNANAVDSLMQLAEAGGRAGDAALQALSAVRGSHVDRVLVNRMLYSENANTRTVAIKSLANRRVPDTFSAFVRLTQDESESVRQEAVRGLKQIASTQEISTLLCTLNEAQNEETRKALTEATQEEMGKMENPEQREAALVQAYEQAGPDSRIALLELMGEFGGEKALSHTRQALRSDNRSVQRAAFYALCEWPDSSPLPVLLEIAQKIDIQEAHERALKSSLRMLGSGAPDDAASLFQTAFKAARTPMEKGWVIDTVGQRANFDTLAFLEPLLDDAELGAKALENYWGIVKKLETSELKRDDWRTRASANRRNTRLAVDGDLNTRWDTGESQKPGQWFTLDLGGEKPIDTIVLNAQNSSGDYPRGYEVYLSNDGENWGEPVAKGKGEKPILEISLPSLSARHIRIVQTGEAEGLFWSIHEITVTAKADPEKLLKAKEVLKNYSE